MLNVLIKIVCIITNYPLAEDWRLKNLSRQSARCPHQKYADQLSKTGLYNSQVSLFPYLLPNYKTQFTGMNSKSCINIIK